MITEAIETRPQFHADFENWSVARYQQRCGGMIYFGGGFCTKLIPFSMLPLRSALQASRSCCSPKLMSGMRLMAFSAPEGYLKVSDGEVGILYFFGHTPSSTGTEKYSTPTSLIIASPPVTPGRYTKVGSTIPFSPLVALMSFSAKLCFESAQLLRPDIRHSYRKPAYAIDNVAEPKPPFASTTSSPPYCTPF